MTRIGEGYFRQNLDMLANASTDPALIRAFEAHWKGDLLGAKEAHAQVNIDALPSEARDFALADRFLVDVKRGGLDKLPTPPTVYSLRSKIVVHYAVFSWAFWVDHRKSWRALFSLIFIAFIARFKDAFKMGVFLTGHMLAIRGWKRLGFFAARMIHNKAIENACGEAGFLRHFSNIVFASFPYTCLTSGANYSVLEKSIFDGEARNQCDPYYRSIFDVSALYAAAYNGDIARAEVYSQSLKLNILFGQTKRYEGLVDVVVLIPYALRGYGHLAREQLCHLPTADIAAEPLVAAQTCRLLAFIALHDGRWEDAKDHVAQARLATSRLGPMSFWQRIDQQIEKTALSAKPFQLTDLSPFVATTEAGRSVDTLGALLTELLSVSGKSSGKTNDWFVHQIATAIGKHIGSERFRTVSKNSRLEGALPFIKLLDCLVFFLDVSSGRLAHVRQVLSAIGPMISTLDRSRNEQLQLQRMSEAAALGRLALQVSHDMRSPLAALDVLRSTASELQEDHRALLGLACERIGHIAGQLSLRGKENDGRSLQLPRRVCVEALLSQVVLEKKFEFSLRENVVLTFDLSDAARTHFVDVDAGELCRAVSNIINNAMESFTHSGGTVKVSTRTCRGKCVVNFEDTGQGIPPDVLGKLGQEGATFNKFKGSGLGLFHARNVVEGAGGFLDIASIEGKGTAVHLHFPLVSTPPWFCGSLEFRRGHVVAILDDDQTIHRAWQRRLSRGDMASTTCHVFSVAADLEEWLDKRNQISAVSFLVDYDLRPYTSGEGLKLIQSRGLSAHSILVTNKFGNRALQSTCESLGMRMLPKPLIENVPIRFIH